ncbi:hypothetical protein [Fusibacter ferrireducens]|uniref:DUF5050 domain-containing protein n=1 Tax=Fusibacter ferrireducens TaxID=2785058 RepID=A0ABR9ZYI0_9FIRM|nr:hypothetical protein [Fusibacter ferrireducens]MBF4695510.1 hypothetical protein [Fusibacter ferrireducens]
MQLKKKIRINIILLFTLMLVSGLSYSENLTEKIQLPEDYSWDKGEQGRTNAELAEESSIIKKGKEYYFVNRMTEDGIYRIDEYGTVTQIVTKSISAGRHLKVGLNKIGDNIIFCDSKSILFYNVVSDEILDSGIKPLEELLAYEDAIFGIDTEENKLKYYNVVSGESLDIINFKDRNHYLTSQGYPDILGIDNGILYVYGDDKIYQYNIASRILTVYEDLTVLNENGEKIVPLLIANGNVYYEGSTANSEDLERYSYYGAKYSLIKKTIVTREYTHVIQGIYNIKPYPSRSEEEFNFKSGCPRVALNDRGNLVFMVDESDLRYAVWNTNKGVEKLDGFKGSFYESFSKKDQAYMRNTLTYYAKNSHVSCNYCKYFVEIIGNEIKLQRIWLSDISGIQFDEIATVGDNYLFWANSMSNFLVSYDKSTKQNTAIKYLSDYVDLEVKLEQVEDLFVKNIRSLYYGENIVQADQKIYFISEAISWFVEKGNLKTIEGLNIKCADNDIDIDEKHLVYQDDEKLFYINLDTGTKTLLKEAFNSAFSIYNDALYYIDPNDSNLNFENCTVGRVHKIDLESGKDISVADREVASNIIVFKEGILTHINPTLAGSWIFGDIYDTDGYALLDPITLNEIKVYSDVRLPNLYRDDLYFLDSLYSNTIYKYNAQNKNMEEFFKFKFPIQDYYFANDKIYYTVKSESYLLLEGNQSNNPEISLKLDMLSNKGDVQALSQLESFQLGTFEILPEGINFDDTLINDISFPFLKYEGVVYIPVTYKNSNLFDWKYNWDNDIGFSLEFKEGSDFRSRVSVPNFQNSGFVEVTLANYDFMLNGKKYRSIIDGFPIINYKGITYVAMDLIQ